jgi:hypothetical protein
VVETLSDRNPVPSGSDCSGVLRQGLRQLGGNRLLDRAAERQGEQRQVTVDADLAFLDRQRALGGRNGDAARTKWETAGLAFALTFLGFKRSDPNE